NGSDPQDWDSSANDACNAFGGNPNLMTPFTPVDVTAVDVIGYDLANLIWKGTADHTTWDIFNTVNWSNGSDTMYTDAARLVFDDSATPGSSNIVLNQTVLPTSVTVNSSVNNYTISGSGSIAGGASLLKMGSSTLTLNNVNTYTGSTIVAGGTLVLGASLTHSSAVTVRSGAVL